VAAPPRLQQYIPDAAWLPFIFSPGGVGTGKKAIASERIFREDNGVDFFQWCGALFFKLNWKFLAFPSGGEPSQG
jgi:hypothetical protein